MELDNSSEDEGNEADTIQWKWLEQVWPKDSRPSLLLDRAAVSKMTIQDINLMHGMYVTQLRAESSKLSLLKKDELPPKIKYGEGKDDGQERLHPARWLRLPFVHPKKYYEQVPIKHEHKYKNLALEFGGCNSNIADRTIHLLHDRRNVVEIKHFMSENSSVASRPMKEIRRKEDEELVTLSDYNWAVPQSVRQVRALINYLDLHI